LSISILHLIPNLSGGGAEQQLSYLASKLVQMGHQVHIAYLRDGPAAQELPDVMLNRLRARSNYDPYILWQLIRIITQIKPDIVHTWILQMDIIGGIASKITRIPWILREPSCQMAYNGTWKFKLRERVVGLSAAIVSNSSGGDSYWRSHYANKRRYIIPNGLPLEMINDIRPQTGDNENLGSSNKVLLYAGRLETVKNIDKLIEATHRVINLYPIKLIICGDGPIRGSLEKQVGRLGLNAVVQFAGFIDSGKLWAWMKNADAFCSISDYEGLPNSVIEAMACGCPLIVSDIPAHREFLNDRCALLVDPADPEEISKAIQLSLSNPNAAKERAEIGKKIAHKWSISSMAEQYEKVYQQILKNRLFP
jgi:glycosyltransferase involved in cell wall biosynthesis